MARTYISSVPEWSTCETEYCGSVWKLFCVKCRHFVIDCRCCPGICECETNHYWAAKGERTEMRKLLELGI